MKYVLALRALEAELYNRLPSDFLILNFCFSSFEYYDEDNVINIDMLDYGIMNPSYILLRGKALTQVIKDNINRDDILLMYVQDLTHCDGFLNITNSDYFLADFMYKRKYLNYYLYKAPTIFEKTDYKEFMDHNLKELMEYGTVVPIQILRNFLTRNSESTNRIMAVNIANEILDIVSRNTIMKSKNMMIIR